MANGNGAAHVRDDRVTQAYQQLRELIVRGKLAPGTWIIESDVAARLGVSRTPVRSALQRLQQEGYILVTARGQQYRAAVAPLTRDDANELFGIVGQLEALAARWAAGKPEAERAADLRELRRLNQALLDAARGERPDHNVVFELDTQFHRSYVEAGGGPRLRALHEAIKPQAERYVRLYISALMDEIGTSVEEHQRIIDGIAAADPDAAQRAVETNWLNAAQRLSRVIDTLGERGSW